MAPIHRNRIRSLLLNILMSVITSGKKIMMTEVIATRHQTNEEADKEIRSPSIAVKLHKITDI